MPVISRFFGVVISMYHNDHLPPHFHARYAGEEAVVGIDQLIVLHGHLQPRVLGLVLEWAARHRDELRTNWELARKQLPLEDLEPLD